MPYWKLVCKVSNAFISVIEALKFVIFEVKSVSANKINVHTMLTTF